MSRNDILMILLKQYEQDTRVRKEAATLAAHDFSVTVFAWTGSRNCEGKETSDSIILLKLYCHLADDTKRRRKTQTYRFPHPTIRLVLLSIGFMARALLAGLRDEGKGPVWAHDLTTLPLALAISTIRRRPLVYDSHEDYPALLKSLGSRVARVSTIVERLLLSFVDVVVTVNHSIASRFSALGCPTFIVENFVDLRWFDSCVGRQNPWSILSGKQVILYEGVVREDRCITELVQAKELIPNPCVLVIAGDTMPPGDLPEWQSRLESEDTMFIGWVGHEFLPNLIAESTVGVSLHDHTELFAESLATKILEYHAGGLPVVASEVPGNSRLLLEPPISGVLVSDSRDSVEIARAITGLLQRQALRNQLGRNGRAKVERNYNWEMVAPRLVAAAECANRGSGTR